MIGSLRIKKVQTSWRIDHSLQRYSNTEFYRLFG